MVKLEFLDILLPLVLTVWGGGHYQPGLVQTEQVELVQL